MGKRNKKAATSINKLLKPPFIYCWQFPWYMLWDITSAHSTRSRANTGTPLCWITPWMPTKATNGSSVQASHVHGRDPRIWALMAAPRLCISRKQEVGTRNQSQNLNPGTVQQGIWLSKCGLHLPLNFQFPCWWRGLDIVLGSAQGTGQMEDSAQN